MLTLGSLFDGIGGWQLAAVRARIKPKWSSEIERFPLAVTAKRFPGTEQLGDTTVIDGGAITPVDIITMGSPCQNLSVAGNRKGLSGGQSSLFIHGIRIIREMQRATAGRYPRFVVWENVPGAFSSNKGLDFKTVLEQITETEIPKPDNGKWALSGMARCRDCDITWRVLDAQYWGVPQRRKRIFLVADFARFGRCADKILFELKSVQGNITQGTQEVQAVTAGAETGAYKAGTMGFDATASVANSNPVVTDGTPPIKTKNEIAVLAGNIINRTTKNGGNGIGVSNDICYTLTTVDRHAVYDVTHASDVIRLCKNNVVGTLQARMGTSGNQVSIINTYATTGYHGVKEDSVAATLKRLGGNHQPENYVSDSYVRKLTPLECERLQGLPDNWTLIDDKSCSDSARYKAIGNGMAQPCADFVMGRIAGYVGVLGLGGGEDTCKTTAR